MGGFEGQDFRLGAGAADFSAMCHMHPMHDSYGRLSPQALQQQAPSGRTGFSHLHGSPGFTGLGNHFRLVRPSFSHAVSFSSRPLWDGFFRAVVVHPTILNPQFFHGQASTSHLMAQQFNQNSNEGGSRTTSDSVLPVPNGKPITEGNGNNRVPSPHSKRLENTNKGWY